MPQPMTLAVIGGLTLAGAAVGGLAGRAAIAEINPVYFAERADTFHGERAAYRSPDWAPSTSAGVQDAQLVEGLGDGCLTCGAIEIPRGQPALAVYQEHWEAEAASPEPAAAAFVEAEPDLEIERLRRYASYPISAEEAEAAQRPREPEPEEYASAEPEAL